ncbi:MAG: hypothetical protein AB1757_08130 [Acidobacteriota bacterium]
MICQEGIIDSATSLAQRRAFLKLPLSERRRILAEQAEQLLESYQREETAKQRETWQGGNIVKP